MIIEAYPQDNVNITHDIGVITMYYDQKKKAWTIDGIGDDVYILYSKSIPLLERVYKYLFRWMQERSE